MIKEYNKLFTLVSLLSSLYIVKFYGVFLSCYYKMSLAAYTSYKIHEIYMLH